MSKIHLGMLSGKQLEVVKIIVGGLGFVGGPNGVQVLIPIDFDDLLTRLSYKPSKQSTQFIIRTLVTKGMIVKGDPVKRRGRMRVIFLPTEAGKFCVNPTSAPDASLGTGNIEAVFTDFPEIEVLETQDLSSISDLNSHSADDFDIFP